MPVRPDDIADFAAALQTLVDQYRYYWETPNAEILDALNAQQVVIVAELGTMSGGASSIVSETPDPPPLVGEEAA